MPNPDEAMAAKKPAKTPPTQLTMANAAMMLQYMIRLGTSDSDIIPDAGSMMLTAYWATKGIMTSPTTSMATQSQAR